MATMEGFDNALRSFRAQDLETASIRSAAPSYGELPLTVLPVELSRLILGSAPNAFPVFDSAELMLTGQNISMFLLTGATRT